jgi:2-oxoacid:acceptor oxidoreductase gamma subunit (pyruvate/2-ketoisovalerate family)
VASRVLAEAAFLGGNHVQAFPAFGLERRGAPVEAFTRIQDVPILNHSKVYEPDAVVVLDLSLLDIVDVAVGVKDGGVILINSPQPPSDLAELGTVPATIATVNASAIAASHGLGSRTQPIVNTAILGALARVSGYVTIETITRAIKKNVAIKTDQNIRACEEAFQSAIF